MTDLLALDNAILRVRTKFLALLEERVAILDQSLYEATENAEALENALFVVHKIGGSSGTLGLVALGQEAQKCEAVLLQEKSNTGSISSNGARAIRDFQAIAIATLSNSATA